MRSIRSVGGWLLCRMILGESALRLGVVGGEKGWLANGYVRCRLLDKIAKDIMVCENKTIRRWDGSIGSYKNHLRKKMVSMGQV